MSFCIPLQNPVFNSFKELAPFCGQALDTGRETTAIATSAPRGRLNGTRSLKQSNFLRHQSVDVTVMFVPAGGFFTSCANSFFHFNKLYFCTCHSSISCFLLHSLSKYCWANDFTFTLPYSENPGSSLSGTCVGLKMLNAEISGREGNLLNMLSFSELTYLIRKW